MGVMYGVVAVALAAALTSAASLTMSFNTIAGNRSQTIAQSETIEGIDRDSAIVQAEFERYAQQGEGLVVTGYFCDAATPPEFDSLPWAKDADVPVTSDDGYHVGNVEPDGTYRHFGYCSK